MQGNTVITLIVILVVVLFSMVLHELAHGLVAYWLGDDTAKDDGRLTLNPLKHLDPVMSFLIPILMFLGGGPIFGGAKPVPVDTKNIKHGPWGMALVALAGPLTNFLLALIGFLIGVWTGLIVVSNGMPGFVNNLGGIIMMEIVMVNLGFGIFNLIPIPPLDGSRILYAISPDGVRNIMDQMETLGIILVMALVILFPSALSLIMNGALEGILHAFAWLVGGA